MLANAVPSLMAEVLACEIRTQLLKQRPASKKLHLLPPVRTPVTAPVTVSRPPKKYHQFIGDHADHPGNKRKTQRSSSNGAQSYPFSTAVAGAAE